MLVFVYICNYTSNVASDCNKAKVTDLKGDAFALLGLVGLGLYYGCIINTHQYCFPSRERLCVYAGAYLSNMNGGSN